MDDWKLLNDYATKNSEEAFRALVELYAGMVYHAALRQTGNPHAAEDVAQDVFIALAQKADKIPRQATLYGWLFRAMRFAALNQARKNVNRQRREQAALVMQPTIEANEADSFWERITPHLNDALEKLSAADRELVMSRFFGNKSHKDVAEALGVSEETARKRISRAIERLRVIFARRLRQLWQLMGRKLRRWIWLRHGPKWRWQKLPPELLPLQSEESWRW
jgi:RNA polymerase sigma factor (sigma-70 family)